MSNDVRGMARANKLGLVVMAGSTAGGGNGPTGGTLVKMDLTSAFGAS